MINDIRSRNNSRTLLVKYADDTNLSTSRTTNYDCAPEEVDSIKKGATENKMSINLTKTKNGLSEVDLRHLFQLLYLALNR